jgi:hypothetical protein
MEQNLSNSKKTDQEIEQSEIDLLTGAGFRFSVKTVYRKRAKGLRGLFGKKEVAEEINEFEIIPPKLALLDHVSRIALDFEMNESELKSESVFRYARENVTKNAGKLAEIIAISVLGDNYIIAVKDRRHSPLKFMENKKEVKRLTELFYYSLNPAELLKISLYLFNSPGLGDFISSIRFLRGAITTTPITERIE